MAAKLAARAELEMSKPESDIKLLMNILSMCTDFLAKRDKYKPAEPEDDSAGVAAIRQMLEDPTAVVERLHANQKFRTALKAKGWLPPAPRPAHRPTKEQQAEREAYDERIREMGPGADADDGELASMLKGKV